MLSRADDYPIHQTPEPIAVSGTDRNFYDRYFFNGYAPDGSGFFAAAFGIYPHLNVADAHFSVIRDGVQHNLHASKELGMERLDLQVGPIRIEIIEPLKVLRVTVDGEGLKADLTFTGRAPDTDLFEVLSTMDLGVNPDRVNAMNDKSTMNKIMEYMSLAKPMVQFDVTEGRFSAQDASLYAEANNPVDLAEKIVALVDDPAARRADEVERVAAEIRAAGGRAVAIGVRHGVRAAVGLVLDRGRYAGAIGGGSAVEGTVEHR